MAFTSHPHHGSRWRLQSLTNPVAQLALRAVAEWRHRRTERLLEGLPAEIRKDIGWPARDSQKRPILCSRGRADQ